MHEIINSKLKDQVKITSFYSQQLFFIPPPHSPHSYLKRSISFQQSQTCPSTQRQRCAGARIYMLLPAASKLLTLTKLREADQQPGTWIVVIFWSILNTQRLILYSRENKTWLGVAVQTLPPNTWHCPYE